MDCSRRLQLGADDYIFKPFNPEIVRLRAGNLLERFALRRQLELALSGAHQGLWDCDVAHGSVALIAGWAEPLGYAKGETPPMQTPWERLVHTEDHAGFQRASGAFANLSQGLFEVEVRLRDRDGQWIWSEVRGEAITRNLQGKPLRMLGTFMDSSRRKLAEFHLHAQKADLATLLESLPDTIIVCDEHGYVERCHLAPNTVFLQPIESLLGQHFGELLPASVATQIVEARAALDTTGQATVFLVSLNAQAGPHHFDVIVSRIAENGRSAPRMLLLSLDAEVKFGDAKLYCTASIGVRLFNGADSSVTQILEDADTAMYAAKKARSGTLQFHAGVPAQA